MVCYTCASFSCGPVSQRIVWFAQCMVASLMCGWGFVLSIARFDLAPHLALNSARKPSPKIGRVKLLKKGETLESESRSFSRPCSPMADVLDELRLQEPKSVVVQNSKEHTCATEADGVNIDLIRITRIERMQNDNYHNHCPH